MDREKVKILLLNPPMNYGAYNEGGRLYLDKSYPPLGIAYLGAVLERENYDVKILDLVDTSFEDVRKILLREKPDILGVSCNLTDYRWGSVKVAQIAKQVDPNVKVVMGGSHATHMYEQILANFPVDYIVRFEGELALLDLLKSLETGSDLRKVQGIAYKIGDSIVKTEDSLPIVDLDSLPFPAYHFFDFDKYIHYSSPLKFKERRVSELKSANIMASRGCPYSCQYCSIAKFWYRLCRFRSVSKVVDEMEMLRNKYGISHFNFFDDVFTLKEERVIELCKEIINRKLDVCWECVTRVDFISLTMLEWMKKAGCLSVSFGVESGSSSVLKSIDKRTTPFQIAEAFRMTHEAGINAYILLMVGNPRETDQSISETIELLRLIKPDKIRTTLTMVYPATDLYQICKQKGFIDDAYWLTEKAAPVYTLENSINKLKKWETRIIFSYYLQKRKTFRVFETIIYRAVFKNFRELIRRLSARLDVQMEKVDHLLHSA